MVYKNYAIHKHNLQKEELEETFFQTIQVENMIPFAVKAVGNLY